MKLLVLDTVIVISAVVAARIAVEVATLAALYTYLQ